MWLRFEEALGLPQRLVEPAERRAAIARDETRRIQAGRDVALALQHRQPDQRLDAGHQHPPTLQRVAVVQLHIGEPDIRRLDIPQLHIGQRHGRAPARQIKLERRPPQARRQEARSESNLTRSA